MIQNRIDFIQEQLGIKQELFMQYSRQLQEILLEKEKITVEVLDEGLLDELNMLNRRIEELSLKKEKYHNLYIYWKNRDKSGSN